MGSTEIRCVICGDVVNHKTSTAAAEVVGWISKRSQGGANQIKYKKQTGRWAHTYCLSGQRHDKGQLTIDDYL